MSMYKNRIVSTRITMGIIFWEELQFGTAKANAPRDKTT